MNIEQSLMHSMKSMGGLTRCRDVTDSALSKWVLGMTVTHDICLSLEDFCGILFSMAEQYEDFRGARRTRDAADIDKLSAWLNIQPSFPELKNIMSIATGLVGMPQLTVLMP